MPRSPTRVRHRLLPERRGGVPRRRRLGRGRRRRKDQAGSQVARQSPAIATRRARAHPLPKRSRWRDGSGLQRARGCGWTTLNRLSQRRRTARRGALEPEVGGEPERSGRLEVEPLTDLAEVSAEWDRVAAASGNVFATREWV